jgi:hypothetical protein
MERSVFDDLYYRRRLAQQRRQQEEEKRKNNKEQSAQLIKYDKTAPENSSDIVSFVF